MGSLARTRSLGPIFLSLGQARVKGKSALYDQKMAINPLCTLRGEQAVCSSAWPSVGVGDL